MSPTTLVRIGIFLGLGFSLSYSQPHKQTKPNAPTSIASRGLRYIYGRYEIPITNDGRFGWDPEYNVPGGGRWPLGSNEGYIFGAGIWIGALVDSVKQVTVGYNPINIQTELVPGTQAGYTGPNDILYISTDYPNPELPPWPRGQGGNGLPITVSQMDSWSQCNDLDPSRQFENGKPLGVLLTTETFSWNGNFRDVWDIVFIRYTIKNVNPDTKKWSQAYIGFAMDADIGEVDLTGCFPDMNLGFTYGWSEESNPQGREHPLGYVGIKVLDGPVRDGATGAAKMTSFTKWTSDLIPTSDVVRYNLLARGAYDITDAEGGGDRKMSIGVGPFDLAAGDSVQLVLAVLFAWPEWYYNPAVKGVPERRADHLRLVASNAQWIYDNGFRFPQPPDMPKLSLVPDDRKIIVAWDDASERTIEQSISFPGITDAHDFEGYRLWKSPTGAEGSFALLDEWDVVDYDDLGRPIGRNTGLLHSYVDKNLTNGKTYFYALSAYDRGEYEATHYGEEEFVVVTPLETGKNFGINLRAEIPNVLPSNFTSPQFKDFSMTAGRADEVQIKVSPQFIVRDSVRNQKYTLAFGNPPGVRIDLTQTILGPDIFVVNTSSGDTVSKTLNFPITYPPSTLESELFGGTRLSFTGPNLLLNRIDTVYFKKRKTFVRALSESDYSKDYITFQTCVPRIPPLAFFFQPHTYLVEFLDADFVKVTDLTTGRELEFELRTLGSGYAFANYERRLLSTNPATNDTTWLWVNEPASFKRRPYSNANGYKIYLPGVFISIEDIGREIHPGDSLFVVLAGKASPRAGDTFGFATLGSAINYRSDLSVIKVVPNPYLVRDAWDLDNDYQRVQFINLPTECTIRIYTLSGDLVKSIVHSEPYAGGFEQQTRGTAYWNLQTENRQKVATGVYLYYVSSPFGQTTGKFAIIR